MKKFNQTHDVMIHVQKYISGRTLDFGAGLAKYREIIKQKATEYITLDIVPGDNIDVVGDVLNSPFDKEAFDTVISTQVIEHVRKPWIMVQEIHRILRKGGICILTAPFLIPYHADPHDYFRYTAEGVKSLFEDAGFKTIECSSYGKPFTVLSEFLRFLWFNPYQKKKKGNWRITRTMNVFANFLNRFTKNIIIYPAVYIIAEKI
jgi:SAM-dependent methyltransferase